MTSPIDETGILTLTFDRRLLFGGSKCRRYYSMLYALCAYAILDGSDLLAHKNIVTDAETEKGDGHNRDQVWNNDDEALQKGKRILEASQREPFQGAHENQTARGFPHGIEDRRGGIPVKSHGREKGGDSLYLLMLDEHLGIDSSRATLTNRSYGICQKARSETDEEGEKDPYRQGGQGRSGCAPKDHGEEN